MSKGLEPDDLNRIIGGPESRKEPKWTNSPQDAVGEWYYDHPHNRAVQFSANGRVNATMNLRETLALLSTESTARIKAEEALKEVLGGLGALGGSWWELQGYGFTEERAKEVCALTTEPEGSQQEVTDAEGTSQGS